MIRYSFICICIVLLCSSCDISNQGQDQIFQYPFDRSSVEKVLKEQELDWLIQSFEYTEGLQSIYTLKNNDNITIGISTKTNDYGNILNITWSLPSDLTEDKFNHFYHSELLDFFKLVDVLYKNNKELEKGLNEFLNYYLKKDYKDGVYWTKRLKEDHLIIEIKPWINSQDSRNRLGTFMVISNNAYENYLNLRDESLRKTAEIDNIEIINCTVDEFIKISQDIDSKEFLPKYFIITGHLVDVKEIKIMPESLKNIETNFLKANRDKYLNAKLIDKTGSVDVFLQTTSLNDNDLKRVREHSVLLLFYENAPVLVVCNSVLIE